MRRRAPYGARGLKFRWILAQHNSQGRAPYGARGLKLFMVTLLLIITQVAPRMGRVD